MNPAEALDVTRIYSIAGMLPGDTPLIRTARSARRTTRSRMPGWWRRTLARPGEISLAHRGVLFLDELPEFGQHTLEVLRQPLRIGRDDQPGAGSLTFPANFMLVGAMNPCRAAMRAIRRRSALQPHADQPLPEAAIRPLLDRIDIHVEVPRVPFQKLSDDRRGEASRRSGLGWRVRGRGKTARFAGAARPAVAGSAPTTNADMGPTEVRDHCAVDEAGRQLLGTAMRQMHLSARAYHASSSWRAPSPTWWVRSASSRRTSRRRFSIGRGGRSRI